MTRQATPEQQAAAEEKRAKFRGMVQTIAKMGEAERANLAARISPVTVEGHQLSLHNAILIGLQMPTATIVGGFRQWKADGRNVRKGEHGLMIWVPRFASKASEAASGDQDAAGSPEGFIVGYVFDVSQTEAVSIEAAA